MTDLFKYNPTPWTHARCGDNWDINLPGEPDATGVGVVATVFAGEANARLIAAAPELYEAAVKHLEWIDKEHAGPDYGGLTRDTHPDGERIWRKWWDEQLDFCADTERLCRAGLAKARGDK